MSSTVDTMVDDESSGPQAPQEIVNDFWENLVTKKPAKVTRIFPASLYQSLLPPQKSPGTVSGKNAAESYQAAADECRARVKRIVRECHRINEKFTDPDFDIASDMGTQNCLKGLMNWYEEDSSEGRSSIPTSALAGALTILNASGILVNPTMAIDLNATTALLNGNDDDESARGPKAVHRLDWIFEKPAFTIDGYSSSDLKQGQNGDCWFIAAVAAICSNPSLMDRVCVERDEECGVYGFVFNRDGEWIWTVVDDNLYLKYEDFDDDGDYYDPTGARERKYKKNYQTGSDALYFASCTDQNETWLPLLEKAYAKAHGDYDSIVGGLSGEAIEDLTGGVTTKILTDRILSKERLWKELIQANKEFLFSASSPSKGGDDTNARKGLALNHAYSVIKATEEEGENGEKHRLVLIRNPWGKRANASMGEWTGSWSDGSKEWTPYWLTKLNHTFGDDGLFWMAYDDLLAKFEMLDRTRIFDKEWTVVQTWTSVNISWVTGYLNTKFQVEIKKAGPTVFVLCQLDDRYFRGLQGKYEFNLHFLLQEEGTEPGEHIVRARSPWFGDRSISAEVDLEPGKYDVVLKIVGAQNNDASEVHDVVTRLAKNNPQKLRQIGLNYDIANAKGFVEETEEEKKKNEKKKKEAQEKKRKAKEEAEKEKAEFEAWKKEKAEKAAKKKAGKAAEEVKDKDAKSTSEETTKATESVEKPKDEAQGELETDDSEETDEESSKENQKEAKANPQPTSTEADTTSNEQHTKTPSTKSSTHAPASAPALAPSNSSVPAADSHSVSNDAGEAPPDPIPDEIVEKAKEKEKPTDNKQNPWNAICVLGLRVYSQDPQVSIKLIKPKDPEEAAVLDADGATPAGATM